MKRMKNKEDGLNIVLTNVTNLLANYLQLLPSTHTSLSTNYINYYKEQKLISNK
jgi:hypothetical protein